MAPYILDNLVDRANEDSEEDCEVPEELARLLRQEENIKKKKKSSISVLRR